MACSCGKSSTASASQRTYTVKMPDGSVKSYRSEVEARAAAQRLGGQLVSG